MSTDRRNFLRGSIGAAGLAGAALALGTAQQAGATTPANAPGKSSNKPFAPPAGPRARVIISNDLGADPDGLFAFVHQILCTSTDVRAVVGAHAQLPKDFFDTGKYQAQDSADIANKMLKLIGRRNVPVYAGSNDKLVDANTPRVTEGAKAIVAEAMRTDTKLPLYLTAGGTLTDIASAYLMEPKIADKVTLIWIGGSPYPNGGGEYNLNADVIAARVIFNNSTMPIWQIPSDVYSMCVVSDFELQRHLSRAGAIGKFLWENQLAYYARFPINFGETYQLGDSPLVLLTALGSPWGATNSYSSPYETIFAPTIGSNGSYAANTTGRKIRVYKGVDLRLMYHDFFSKMRTYYG